MMPSVVFYTANSGFCGYKTTRAPFSIPKKSNKILVFCFRPRAYFHPISTRISPFDPRQRSRGCENCIGSWRKLHREKPKLRQVLRRSAHNTSTGLPEEKPTQRRFTIQEDIGFFNVTFSWNVSDPTFYAAALMIVPRLDLGTIDPKIMIIIGLPPTMKTF